MKLKRYPYVFAFSLMTLSMSFAKEPTANLSQYKSKVLPVINKYCSDCHDSENEEGGVNFEKMNPDLFTGQDGEHWEEVLNQINRGDMPPKKKKKQPGASEREIITSWLQGEMTRAAQFRKSTGGKVVMRRLTRYEYNYTLQDMLDVHINHTKNMPQDQSNEHGLQNSGLLLTMNANQMEGYMEISDMALKKALWTAEKPKIHKGVSNARSLTQNSYPVSLGGGDTELTAEGIYFTPGFYGGPNIFSYSSNPRVPVRISRIGKIRISVKAGGLPDAAGKMPRLRVWIGYNADKNNWTKKLVGEVTVTSSPDKPKVYEFITEISELPLAAVGPNKQGKLSARPVIIFVGQGDEVYGDRPLSLKRQIGHRGLATLDKNFQASKKRYDVLRKKSQQLNDAIRKKSVSAGKDKARKKLSAAELETYKKELVAVNKESKALEINSKYYAWLKNQRRVFVVSMEYESPYFESWPPKARTYIGSESAKGSQRAQIAIKTFAAKAWRRPVNDEELKVYMKGFNNFYKASSNFDESIKLTMGMIMASPNFLYLVEPSAKARTLTSHEVASRLSYFLWSSLPDDELRKLADSKPSLNSSDLNKQIERMLSDPKARRFAKHFTEQWLDSTRMEGIAVDQNFYPDFKEATKESMRREPIEYFWYVLTKNRSALEFIDSNYAVVDEALADHYKLKGVSGIDFRVVPVTKNDHRGGLLTMGGFMLGNSDGGDSNPIYRGKWLLEKILDQGPPPPPPNVEQIVDETNPNFDKLPLIEQLAFHRKEEACAGCHNKLDPWGLALENFDAVGNWRTTASLAKEKKIAESNRKQIKVNGKLTFEAIRRGLDMKVNANAQLPSGHKVNGVADLKAYILKHKQEAFSEALVRTMFAYALGRSPEWTDKAEIDRLTKTFTASGHKLNVLISAIVNSRSFRER